MQHSAGRQTPSNFAPEVALIRACGRALLEPADADHIRHLVARGLDWDRLVWLARPHGMLPLLYRHLSAVCPGSVPSPVLHELQTRFDTNARRNFVVFAEVLEILRLFDKHGIRAIPYRGPVLAMQLYDNVALCQFGDLDVLVEESEAFRASALLASCGYAQREPVGDRQKARFLEYASQFRQVNPATGIAVELHWRFVTSRQGFALRLEHVWSRLELASWSGVSVPALPPEILLLVLCVHGVTHYWERIEWICGVSELVRRYDAHIDWRLTLEHAAVLGCRRALLLGLGLARDLIGCELREEVERAIEEDRAIPPLAAIVHRRLPEAPFTPLDSETRAAFEVGMRERLRDKVGYAFNLMTAPRRESWEWTSLPAHFPLIYRFTRPIRLLVQHGRRHA